MKNKKLTICIYVTILLISITYASVFTNNSQGDFNNGTYSHTFYNLSGFVQLNTTYTTGNFTSKIFNAGDNVSWNNISWIQGGYYQQELPNNKVIENGLNGANMTGNALLMHLNEANGKIIDYSGEDNNGTYNGILYGVAGKFNTALGFDGDDVINISESTSLNFTEEISYSAWFKTNDLSTWAGIISRMKSWPNGYNLQIGTANKIACGWGTYTTSDNIPIVDKWYYAVCVYNGSAMKLYVNGVLQNDIDSGTLKSSPENMKIGVFYTTNSLYFNGTIDEVAVYNRSLSAEEILDNYKRGILKLNLTVKSCDDTNCSGETWIDLNDTSSQNLSLTNNNYFQYKFNFETEDINYSPELYNVTINYNDVMPPSINVIRPIDYSTHHVNWIEANVTLNEASNCNYSLDNSTYLKMDSIDSMYFYKNITNLTEGLHNVTFNCTDLTGNSNLSELITFTISFNPSCFNELKDQDESDIDCGGICGHNCNDTQNCNINSDCLNDVCESGICVSCSDGIKNNNETDIDCGGPNCPGCTIGKNCTNVSDCDGATSCSNGICSSCSDGILNQGEDLIDCGSSYCSACPYLLYFYDDCGNLTNETHLVQGTNFTFMGEINSSLSNAEKSVSYHNEKVIYRYPIDYMYDYKVKIKLLQPTEGGRIQKILADSYILDSAIKVPEYNPTQYSYNIPFSSYNNDSSFDLVLEKVNGPNAVCSEIEVWKSTSVSSSLSESSNIFDFNDPIDYIYNSSEIVIENSSAHLISGLIYNENSSYYDFNPVANDLSYESYNLKTIFNLNKTYNYYNYSIELKREGITTDMFQIAVNNISNIINITNASTISESYQIYTVNIPAYMITDNTPEIWTLKKPNILFRMDGTPSGNSYYRNANDNLNNTGWTLDNNDYYHMLKGYDNISSGSGIIETNDLIVNNLLKWLNVSINDYNGYTYSNESNETYDYASNQTKATASAQGGAEHLIDEDETIDGGDYYGWCSWPCNMSITFNKSAYINKIYIHLWDGDVRYYNYSLWLSSDSNNWVKVVDNKHAYGPQNDTFNATLTKYLKIEGLYNTANNGFHVIEIDAFEAEQEKEIKYFYSIDSGTNWDNLPSNGNISNTSTTNKIRFKTNITGNGTLYDININYYTFTIANCSDGIKNQNETDIDCGGSICSKCSNDKSCLINSDCQDGLCSEGICQTSETDSSNGNSRGGSSRRKIILPSDEEEVIEPIIKLPVTKDFIINRVNEIHANKLIKILFDKYLYSIEIITNTNVNNTIFKVRDLDKIPNIIPKLNNTYKYLKIDAKNLSDNFIIKATIKFKVNKSLLKLNDFDTVALYRFENNTWKKLKTEKFDENNKSIYYKADTPGFSYFAIIGEKVEIITPEIKENITEKPTPIKKPKNVLWIKILFIPILFLIITFFALRHYNINFPHKKSKNFSFESNIEFGKYNSVCKLIGKYVFTYEGLYCGKVSEIEFDLKKSRIGNIKIEIEKQSYLSKILKHKKGILLPYKLVKAIGNIIIINHIDKKFIDKNKKHK